jgi:hypothetical protein
MQPQQQKQSVQKIHSSLQQGTLSWVIIDDIAQTLAAVLDYDVQVTVDILLQKIAS